MVDRNVELIGQRELVHRMVQAGTKVVPALGTALYTVGNLTMRISKNEAPFRYGILKDSGRVFEPSMSGDDVVVDMGFGGAAAKYALLLHDNKGGVHFRNGKKDHYLEDPLAREGASLLSGILAKKIQDII